MPVNQTQIELLRKLLRHGATERVLRIVDKFRSVEIAEIFGSLSPAEQRAFAEMLYTQGNLAKTILELPKDLIATILERMTEHKIAQMLERLPTDDAVFIISLVDETKVESIIQQIKSPKRERIEHVRTYPAETAGSLMTSEMLTLQENLSVQQAIETIREHGEKTEFVFYVYVVNDAKTFVGVVPIRRLIMAQPDLPIGNLMVSDPIAVHAMDDQEEVARLTAQYNLLAVPVVDDTFTLLGVITVDDVIDVLQSEATEDMYLMQGLSDEDRIYAPMRTSVQKRFPWMVLNLCTAFLAALVIRFFEASIAQAVVLVTFMPIVAGMGGNSGTQTLTVMTRAIALGELSFSDSKIVILKQTGIGLLNGAGIGLLTGGVAWFWKDNPYLGFVLFFAMVLNMAISGLAGAAVPLLLKALNFDPALGGGVIVTAFTDVFGFMAFLGLATIFIQYIA